MNVRILNDSAVRENRRPIPLPPRYAFVESAGRSIARAIIRIEDVKPAAAQKVRTIIERAVRDGSIDRCHFALAQAPVLRGVGKAGELLAARTLREKKSKRSLPFF